MSEVRRERDQAVTIPDPESRHSALAIILCRLWVVSIINTTLCLEVTMAKMRKSARKAHGRRAAAICRVDRSRMNLS